MYANPTIRLFHVFLTTILLIFLVSPVCSNLVNDKVTIECGEDPETSMVNVTYFGEADTVYPIKAGQSVYTCEGEYRPDGTYVLLDINHRNCTFNQVGSTNAWTIKIKVQKISLIFTTLDKEYSLTCVYDDFVVADSP